MPNPRLSFPPRNNDGSMPPYGEETSVATAETAATSTTNAATVNSSGSRPARRMSIDDLSKQNKIENARALYSTRAVSIRDVLQKEDSSKQPISTHSLSSKGSTRSSAAPQDNPTTTATELGVGASLPEEATTTTATNNTDSESAPSASGLARSMSTTDLPQAPNADKENFLSAELERSQSFNPLPSKTSSILKNGSDQNKKKGLPKGLSFDTSVGFDKKKSDDFRATLARHPSLRSRRNVKPRKTPRSVYCVAVLAVLVVSIGFFVAVIFGFGAAESLYRKNKIKAKLEDLVEDPDLMDDLSTPQGQALFWLALEDPAQIEESDIQRLEARFALAVLYYSTTGEGWRETFEFLSGTHECDWNSMEGGIECAYDDTITNITLVSNNLRGTIPLELSALSGLESLNLSFNRLTGVLPIWGSDSLKSLKIRRNELDEPMPDNINDFSQLTSLDLAWNMIPSDLPTTIGLLTGLEYLDLGVNNLDGGMPETMVFLSNLKELNMTRNGLTGGISPVLAMRGLVDLDLSFNRFRGPVIDEFYRYDLLRELHLQGNEFTGDLNRTCALTTSSPNIYADCRSRTTRVSCSCCAACFE